jgi:hypothetical protein
MRKKTASIKKTERKNTRMLWILFPLHTWLHAWPACRQSIISLTHKASLTTLIPLLCLCLWQHSSLFCVFMPFLFLEPLNLVHPTNLHYLHPQITLLFLSSYPKRAVAGSTVQITANKFQGYKETPVFSDMLNTPPSPHQAKANRPPHRDHGKNAKTDLNCL